MEAIRNFLGIPSYCIDISKDEAAYRKAVWYEQLCHFLPTFFRPKSVYLLDSRDLDRLSRTCNSLQQCILSLPPKNDQAKLKMKLASIRLELQLAAEDPLGIACLNKKVKTVANSILPGSFSEYPLKNFSLADLKKQAFVDCIIFELEQAFVNNNKENQIECIFRLEEVCDLVNFKRDRCEVHELVDPNSKKLLSTFKHNIQEADFVKFPVLDYLLTLSWLSPKVAIEHCKEVQKNLPEKLVSLSLSEKLKALETLTIKTYMEEEIPEEATSILKSLLEQETDKFLNQMASDYSWLPGEENNSMMYNLQNFLSLQKLIGKELLLKLASLSPSLVSAFQSYLIQQLKYDIPNSPDYVRDNEEDSHITKFLEHVKTIIQASVILKEKKLLPAEMQQIDPELVKYGKENFCKIIQRCTSYFYIPLPALLVIAEMYRTMKELYGFTIPATSIENFERLENQVKEKKIGTSIKPFIERFREQMTPQALLSALPLVEEQKNALIQAIKYSYNLFDSVM